MNCRIGDDLRCRCCGLPARSTRTRRNCSGGLGDIVAAGLDAIGITKARAQAVAQAVGLAHCGCEQRQRLLNDLGRRVGIGMPAATSTAAEIPEK